jgi:sialate O-acetylesterase
MRILLLASLLHPALAAQTFKVTSGATDYQVFQRGPANTATISFEGTASPGARTVEARLVANGMAVAGFDWKQIASVSGSAWKGALQNVPAGGPYRIELRAGAAEASISNILVGDLWVLAGQSNMEGVGNLEGLPVPSAMVNSFDQTDTWVMASDPLHRLPDAADRVHWRRPSPQAEPVKLEGQALRDFIANRRKGAGVGLPFALEMVRRTGVPIGLLPCAHGGTSMDQWSPALKEKGGDSLYGAMLRRVKLAGGNVKGVLWYQGESDAGEKPAPLFKEKFRNFVNEMRRDFGLPSLPVYYVQIGRHVSPAPYAGWNLVQEAQRQLEDEIPSVAMTTCVDCELDDQIHVGTDDFVRLGKRLANLAGGFARRGPRPVSAKLKGNIVSVEFSGVNGHLAHNGRLNGFVIVDAAGAPQPLIFRQRISSSNSNVVELLIQGKLPEGAKLHYGLGRDPYVNLRDSLDMPAPVFGPLAIEIAQ